MGAFQSGFQMGGNMAQQAIENAAREREFELRKAAAEREAEKFNWERTDRAATDSALSSFNNLVGGIDKPTQTQLQGTYGMNPTQITAALRDGGVHGLQAKLASYDVPDSSDLQSVPAAGVQRFDSTQIKPYQASPMDLQNAQLGLAIASRNPAMIAAATEKLNQLRGQDEIRNKIRAGKELYDNRESSPEALAAWQKWAQPYTQMASGFNGLAADFRVNPRTGALEMIPYDGGKVAPLTFEAAMPYVIKGEQLLSQYSDPNAAIEALNSMTEAERKRVLEGTNQRLGVADKLGASDRDVFKNQTDRDYKMGTLGLYERGLKGGSGGGAGGSASVKMTSIQTVDPTTNKPVKIPVMTRISMGSNGVPKLEAFTLDGKPVTDNKMLSQLASGDYSVDNPQMAAIDAQISRLTQSMTGDNFGATQSAIKQLTGQKQLLGLQGQITNASPQERIDLARGLLAQGAKPEVLATIGLTPDEVRQARKPAATPGSEQAGLRVPKTLEQGRADLEAKAAATRQANQSKNAQLRTQADSDLPKIGTMSLNEVRGLERKYDSVLTRAERSAITKRRNELE